MVPDLRVGRRGLKDNPHCLHGFTDLGICHLLDACHGESVAGQTLYDILADGIPASTMCFLPEPKVRNLVAVHYAPYNKCMHVIIHCR